MAASSNMKSNYTLLIWNIFFCTSRTNSPKLYFNYSSTSATATICSFISTKFNLYNLSMKPSPPFQGLFISHVSHVLPISADCLRSCQWRNLGKCPELCSDLPMVVLYSTCSTSGHRFPCQTLTMRRCHATWTLRQIQDLTKRSLVCKHEQSHIN